ncbi:MAG: riboflavin synthase [Acidobacteria bacterium]|nr:riboflavin synthase [Acidobacteriota bacterium]
MFTGIVESVGIVSSARKGELVIEDPCVVEGTRLGDSIAVNGVCLTVTQIQLDKFWVGVAPETYRKTNLGRLKPGDRVNLERALTPSTRMGGHFVQGHVDATATIAEKRPEGDALWLRFRLDPELMRYVVPKGFICVDGISLTVVDVSDSAFSLMLVTYTQSHVTLPHKHIGDLVNIEVDILGKYVEKIFKSGQSDLMDKLSQGGFT